MVKFQQAEWYLPHAAPMVLLENVVSVTEEQAHCQVFVSAAGVLSPFLNAQGDLPAWFGIEMLAQAVGVWSGWHARQTRDFKPTPGMLLGARAYRATAPCFPAGALLDIHVALLMRDEKIGSFEGSISHQGQRLAKGRVNTVQPDVDELRQLLTQERRA